MLLFSILLSIVPFFLNVPLVKAHVLERDGAISGIMHMAPDDEPVGGEETPIHIDFADENNQLIISNCECRLTVSTADNEIIIDQAIESSPQTPLHGYTNVTFPRKGIYTVVVKGRSAVVPPFELVYAVRVEREIVPTPIEEANTFSTLPWAKHVVFFIAVALSVGGIVFILRHHR